MFQKASFASKQLIRYIVIGVTSNISGYLVYLGLTALGGEPKLVMSALYVLTIFITFILNRSVTFEYNGKSGLAFRKYLLTYGMGYLLNLCGLIILVDFMRYPHYLVQGGLIIFVAAVLFVVQKLWVFKTPS